MKKSALVFISVLLCALVCLSVLSCNARHKNGGENSSAATGSSTPQSTPAETPSETPAETKGNNAHYHEFDGRWSINEDMHWHACRHCAVKKDAVPHDFNMVHVNEAPTSDKPGRGIFVCKICNGAFELPLAPLGTETN